MRSFCEWYRLNPVTTAELFIIVNPEPKDKHFSTIFLFKMKCFAKSGMKKMALAKDNLLFSLFNNEYTQYNSID